MNDLGESRQSEKLTLPAESGLSSLQPEAGRGGYRWRDFLQELAETALLAAVIFVVLRLVVQNFRIEGHSMEPNLHDGQFVIVNKLSYRLHEPRRGDIVVFAAPLTPQKDFIKRVIGLPGEEVEIREGIVYINGKPLDEPYIPYPGSRSWGPQRVEPDELLVLGDNRTSSNDSRQWGMLSKSQVKGTAWLCYWPPQHWGFVPHASYAEMRTSP